MNQNKPAVVKKLQERFRNVSVGRGLYMAFMMPTMLSMFSTRAFAADTIWTKASAIMQDVYTQILSKVTFKTNLNDYRTLASNLLTSNNYSLSLNAATLRLVQGEYVTDVRFEFGTVPSGFSSVVKPTMRVQVLGTVSNGYQIINRADVGGQYLNEWQTAKTTWVTTVRRFNTTPLPKTGY